MPQKIAGFNAFTLCAAGDELQGLEAEPAFGELQFWDLQQGSHLKNVLSFV